MYVVRRQTPEGVSFKTYDGWVHWRTGTRDVLDLSEVMRFTKGEATHPLPQGEEWVWFGCYKETGNEKGR